MTATVLDLTIEQGADFSKEITITSGGSPVNLSGWTLYATGRTEYGAATAVFELDSTDVDRGITIDDDGIAPGEDPTGLVTLYISGYDTEALEHTADATWDGVWDLVGVDDAGAIARFRQGNFVISPAVTFEHLNDN